ncbi:MAG: TMEM175 family protein [Actinomycetota bacterium]|nr:TMEM175 family protein [Actinomycetota bacterium]
MKRLYPRGEAEFGRVLAFSDGVYAIAMTLLVLSITLPSLRVESSETELLDELRGLSPQIFSFVLSFAVIGRYWLAHHQFFSRLRALDGGLISINLVSLCVIAFLPFPTDLLGNYFDNPITIVVYALTVAAVSGLEVVMFTRAHHNDLIDPPLTYEVFRWARAAASSPVFFFAISIPLAFLSPVLACAMWFGGIPYQLLYLNPRKPADADTLLA